MLQRAALAPQLTVAEHLALHRSYYPTPRPLEETLAQTGLTTLAPVCGLIRRVSAQRAGVDRRAADGPTSGGRWLCLLILIRRLCPLPHGLRSISGIRERASGRDVRRGVRRAQWAA